MIIDELEDPVAWIYETGTLPCDEMWIGRTRYIGKEKKSGKLGNK